MNIFKKLRKPYIGLFLSGLVLFISCNTDNTTNIEEPNELNLSGDVIFKIGNEIVTYNRGDEHFSAFNSFGEEKILMFKELTNSAFVKQDGRNSDNNLLIEFESTGTSVQLNNIEQLSNNSVSMDFLYDNTQEIYKSSVTLETDITVNEFMTTLIGEHDLGNTSAIVSRRCPWCVVIVVVAVIAACENAQNACSPCNGTLEVGACGCSCTPIPNT